MRTLSNVFTFVKLSSSYSYSTNVIKRSAISIFNIILNTFRIYKLKILIRHLLYYSRTFIISFNPYLKYTRNDLFLKCACHNFLLKLTCYILLLTLRHFKLIIIVFKHQMIIFVKYFFHWLFPKRTRKNKRYTLSIILATMFNKLIRQISNISKRRISEIMCVLISGC